jgi:mRNA-degrading endonuclease YafQ of YafQ-DinJ toxin-antitoxin module
MRNYKVKKHLVNLGKILSDWIVIYEIIEEKFVLILLRTGTHQDLFKNY